MVSECVSNLPSLKDKEGSSYVSNLPPHEFSVVLPLTIKGSTLQTDSTSAFIKIPKPPGMHSTHYHYLKNTKTKLEPWVRSRRQAAIPQRHRNVHHASCLELSSPARSATRCLVSPSAMRSSFTYSRYRLS